MIPVLQPKLVGNEIGEIKKVLKSGWWGMGKKTIEFENEFAKFVGAKYAVMTNSCT